MKLKNIVFMLLVMVLLSIPAAAQTEERVKFKKGKDNAVLTRKGDRIFLVDMKKGQTYAATFVIKTNCDLNLYAMEVSRDAKGRMRADPTFGAGYFKNQFGGKAKYTGTHQFQVVAASCGNYEFRIQIN